MDVSPQLRNNFHPAQIKLTNLQEVKLPTAEGDEVESTLSQIQQPESEPVTASADDVLASQNMAMISMAKSAPSSAAKAPQVPPQGPPDGDDTDTDTEGEQPSEPTGPSGPGRPPIPQNQQGSQGTKGPQGEDTPPRPGNQEGPRKWYEVVYDIATQFLKRGGSVVTMLLTPTPAGNGSDFKVRDRDGHVLYDVRDRRPPKPGLQQGR